jgi:uncharacterized protein (TIGR02646 family)
MPKADPSIYAHRAVKVALRNAQADKCAYCETLNPTSHDVVEHFRPKNGWRQKSGDSLRKPEYFWLSYDWENLIFACDRCNDAGHKQNHFPLYNPRRRATAANPQHAQERPLLINPYADDPGLYIEWNRDIPRPRNRSRKGRKTITVFGLDRDGLLMDQRRAHLLKLERTVRMVETYSPNNLIREAMRLQLLGEIENTATWAAMTRANLAARIQAL